MSCASPIKVSVNRIAFFTGAGHGIGRCIACRIARDGYDVFIADIPAGKPKVDDVIPEIKSYSRKAIGVIADVHEVKQIKAAIGETVEKLGPRLFVSVANAGVTQVRPLLGCTPENNKIRINLMVKEGSGGRIVGTGSIASYPNAEDLGPYGATKSAVRGFTEAAGKKWAQYGIRVNAYGPGIVDMPMWDHIDREFAGIEGISIGGAKAKCEPENVAKLVSFLVSAKGEYITSQTIKTCGCASL
ncbi:NAD-P-binding protein [Earliella scabrosa]|nr:NAD-P-binding protein [Earliella scabrosa]